MTTSTLVQEMSSPREGAPGRLVSYSNGSPLRLLQVDRDSTDFAEVKELFVDGWLHPDKGRPKIQYIFEVLWSETALRPYLDYRDEVQGTLTGRDRRRSEKLLFHGTNRACHLGESPDSVRLCTLQECSLCSILRDSFDVSRCGSKHSFKRFGQGIYTTSCSSKADDYVRSVSTRTSSRVMIVSCVVVGKPKRRYKNDPHLIEPPSGYDSVAGKTGEDLNYEETVTYDNDSARPAYLIVYGDKPARGQNVKAFVKRMFKTPIVE